MSVSYKGKSPGKIWYTWQKTKGMFATKQYKPFAKNSTGAGLSATGTVLIQQQLATVLSYLPLGLAGLGGMAAYNAFKAVRPGDDLKNKVSTGDRWKSAAKYAGAAVLLGLLTPTAATWVSLGLIGATGFFGLRSVQSWKAAASSIDVRNYVRKQENTWLDKKDAGPWHKRLGRKIKAIGTSIKMGLAKTVKWGSVTTGVATLAATAIGAAQYAGYGILSAGAAATVTTAATSVGALVGLAAAPALITAAAIVLTATTVTGLLAHNKIREIRASRDAGVRENRFLKKPREIEETPAADTTPAKLSNDNKPQTAATFNAQADTKPAAQPQVETPKAEDSEELSDARRAAAEARRKRRKDTGGAKFG